jgi:hypothetical protein
MYLHLEKLLFAPAVLSATSPSTYVEPEDYQKVDVTGDGSYLEDKLVELFMLAGMTHHGRRRR